MSLFKADDMSLGADHEPKPELPMPKISKIKVAFKKAAAAYAERPLHWAFHFVLAGEILSAFFRFSPDWRAHVLFLALAGIEFHAWFVKDGYLSPVFGRFFKMKRK